MSWLSEKTISQQHMTDALREIWAVTPEAAEARIAGLKSAAESACAQGKLPVALLTAAATERAGQKDAALALYRQLAVDGKDSPFGISASFRALVLGGETNKEKLSAGPPGDAWFLISDAWTWTSRQAAVEAEATKASSPLGTFILGLVLTWIWLAIPAHARALDWFFWFLWILGFATGGAYGLGVLVAWFLAWVSAKVAAIANSVPRY
jgi:hypothetical protein